MQQLNSPELQRTHNLQHNCGSCVIEARGLVCMVVVCACVGDCKGAIAALRAIQQGQRRPK
eukprot:6394533-Amphidinium_carterae.1